MNWFNTRHHCFNGNTYRKSENRQTDIMSLPEGVTETFTKKNRFGGGTQSLSIFRAKGICKVLTMNV